MSAIKKKNVAARRDQFIDSWRKFAPELTLSGYTLAQFEVEAQQSAEVRQRLSAAKTEVAGVIIERKQADKLLRVKLHMPTDVLRGTPGFGYDSPFYRSLGFKPKSEIKRSVRTETVIVTQTIPAAPAPVSEPTVPASNAA